MTRSIVGVVAVYLAGLVTAWTTVTFTLEPSALGTRVTVSETGFDQIALARRAKVYKANSQGWAEVLVWLQKHVEEAR